MFPEERPRETLRPTENSVSFKASHYGVLLFPPDSKNTMLRFQGARPDHVRVKRLSCCLPRGAVTLNPPIRKRI